MGTNAPRLSACSRTSGLAGACPSSSKPSCQPTQKAILPRSGRCLHDDNLHDDNGSESIMKYFPVDIESAREQRIRAASWHPATTSQDYSEQFKVSIT